MHQTFNLYNFKLCKKVCHLFLLIIHFLCINFMILSLGKLPFCLCVNQLNTCVYGIPYSKTQPAWQTRWMSQMSGDVEEREYWRNICLSLDQPWGKLNTVFNLIPFGLHEWALQIGKEWLNIHKSWRNYINRKTKYSLVAEQAKHCDIYPFEGVWYCCWF